MKFIQTTSFLILFATGLLLYTPYSKSQANLQQVNTSWNSLSEVQQEVLVEKAAFLFNVTQHEASEVLRYVFSDAESFQELCDLLFADLMLEEV